jgi:outer membrane protein assembly factor BamB
LVWRETGIIDKFPTEGLLPRVWSTPIEDGYSGPAVADGRVYITDLQREERNERVLCLDADTGDIIWTHAYPVVYKISYPAGPRATPVIDGGLVYTIGAMGHMFCLGAKTGDVKWQKNFVDDFDTDIPTWGMAASPLVDGNQLITLVGGRDALVVSFDKTTGKELWRALNDSEVGYCPPVIFTFGKTRQLIVWHPHAVSSLNPETGKVNWEDRFLVRAGLTVPTPRQIGNRLFVTSFYNGSRMYEVAGDGSSAKIVWQGNSNSERQTDGLHSIMPTPVVTESNIYGICSYGQLRCLDVKTGERIWETLEATGSDRWWNCFLIPHEDRYFLHNEQGDLIIAHLTPKGYEEISRAKLVEPTRRVNRRMTIWSHPAFAMKSVFARNDNEIVRVNLAKTPD